MPKKSTKIQVSDDNSDDETMNPTSKVETISEATLKPKKPKATNQATEVTSDEDAEEVEPVPTEKEIEAELAEGDMLHEEEEELDFDLDAEGEEADKLADEAVSDQIDTAPEAMAPTDEKTIDDAINEAHSDVFAPDSEVDAAVDDIVRAESDESIKTADEKIAALTTKKEKESFGQKIKTFFIRWWQNKTARRATAAVVFGLLTAAILVPVTRYTLLNFAGVRVQSSMNIVDSKTRLPLENISVSIQGEEQRTNESGFVEFSNLKLGSSELVISKRGYAEENRKIVLGWGSNPLGDQGLLATGEQFTFVLSDWLSKVPINQARAVSGEDNAIADETGKIVLTIGEEDIGAIEVVISAEGYRNESFTSGDLDNKENSVAMVPAKKHVFVSNRDGQYDLYKIDADKDNEEIVLEATKKEREIPTVLTHPTKNYSAYISSRDGEENDDGFVLDGLFIIDIDSGSVEKIGRSEQLQLVGWSGDRIVYSQVVEGTSRGNAERSRIVSFNIVTGERIQLAAANYFNDIELFGSRVFYAVSSFAVPLSQAKLYSVQIDGTENEKIVDSQVWTIYRKTYNTLVFNAVDQEWFQFTDASGVEEVEKQNLSPRNFVDSPDGSQTSWTEIRDGKGVLLVSSTGEFNATKVLNLAGLESVQYWLNDSTLVYRVISTTETADYAVSIFENDPTPVKITDVTATQRRLY